MSGPANPPLVRCRHCAAELELRGGSWCDSKGITMCIKVSSSLITGSRPPYLLHEPMPFPLTGSAP